MTTTQTTKDAAREAGQKENKYTRAARFFERMTDLGFSHDEANTLRRIQIVLHRWAEQECGDGNDYSSWCIERDEKTGKPFRCVYPHHGPSRRYPIADRESGALKRARAILARHAGVWMYHQTDPRGCALYIGKETNLNADVPLESQYTRGMAVCI